MAKETIKSNLVIISSTAFLLFIFILQVAAQYDNHQGGYEMAAGYEGGGGGGSGSGSGSGYGYGYGGGDGDGAGDERPKVHLGIRLRIPAIKFELPRFSLPKITVSAKIRQPDRPRTITLPEINLDTSSKVAAPEAGEHPGGSYGATGYSSSSSQYQPTYNNNNNNNNYGGQEKASMFTFSTEQVHPTNGGGYSSNSGGYGARMNQAHRPGGRQQHNYGQSQRYQQQQQQGYSATNVHPSYLMGTNNPNYQFAYNHQHQFRPYYYERAPLVGSSSSPTLLATTSTTTTTEASNRNPELGFSAPVNAELQRATNELANDQVNNKHRYQFSNSVRFGRATFRRY